MRFYISEDGKATMKVKCYSPRFYCRSVLLTILIAGVLLPFLFMRPAFLALEAGTTICPPISCLGWRLGHKLLRKGDSSLEIAKELKRAFMDGLGGGGQNLERSLIETAPESFDHLIAAMSRPTSFYYQHPDLKTFGLTVKALLLKMDRKVQSARLRASIFKHLASTGIPKSMNCLSLMLAEEYSGNALARSTLPPPEHSFRLTNTSYLHIVLMTDNVLAAAAVVSSATSSCRTPERLVFHIVTDKVNYTPVHAWFALHSFHPATVEVKGLHQLDFQSDANASVKDTVEEIRHCLSNYRYYYGSADADIRRILSTNPSTFSFLSYLRIHLPELFPELKTVVLLDDDVVVRRDLSPLWDVHLNGRVIGAVTMRGSDESGEHRCAGKKLGDYLNFSDPMVSSLGLHGDQCAWLDGVNVVDLEAWRSTNITRTYRHWLKLNRESGFSLWSMGSFPPALMAFDGRVHAIEHSWHLPGLGWQAPPPEPERLVPSAVLHFSGPGKPWLEISDPELRRIWQSYLNCSDDFIRSCRVRCGKITTTGGQGSESL